MLSLTVWEKWKTWLLRAGWYWYNCLRCLRFVNKSFIGQFGGSDTGPIVSLVSFGERNTDGFVTSFFIDTGSKWFLIWHFIMPENLWHLFLLTKKNGFNGVILLVTKTKRCDWSLTNLISWVDYQNHRDFLLVSQTVCVSRNMLRSTWRC